MLKKSLTLLILFFTILGTGAIASASESEGWPEDGYDLKELMSQLPEGAQVFITMDEEGLREYYKEQFTSELFNTLPNRLISLKPGESYTLRCYFSFEEEEEWEHVEKATESDSTLVQDASQEDISEEEVEYKINEVFLKRLIEEEIMPELGKVYDEIIFPTYIMPPEEEEANVNQKEELLPTGAPLEEEASVEDREIQLYISIYPESAQKTDYAPKSESVAEISVSFHLLPKFIKRVN